MWKKKRWRTAEEVASGNRCTTMNSSSSSKRAAAPVVGADSDDSDATTATTTRPIPTTTASNPSELPLRPSLPRPTTARSDGVAHPRHSLAAERRDSAGADDLILPRSRRQSSREAGLSGMDGQHLLEDLRKKMHETLAIKNRQRKSDTAVPKTIDATGTTLSIHSPNQSIDSPAQTGLLSASTESGRTIKGSTAMNTPAIQTVRTPSYPFPHMALNYQNTRMKHTPGVHRPFTMLSPTVGPYANLDTPSTTTSDIPFSDPSTPMAGGNRFLPSGAPSLEMDARFPNPNIYDLVLMLNSEPGMDAWWANAVHILHDCYGAERATLAVPGDLTDLENVPWMQKASFNVLGLEGSESASVRAASIPSEVASLATFKPMDIPANKPGKPPTSPTRSRKRPTLENRHSFSGAFKPSKGSTTANETSEKNLRRPAAPPRSVSTIHETTAPWPIGNVEATSPFSPGPTALEAQQDPVLAQVFDVARALETENDPLIKRSGITRLFGRDKPAVLTREYNAEHSSSEPSPSMSKSAPKERRPSFDDSRKTGYKGFLSTHYDSYHDAYEEYEQTPASPWAQSPAPSPAARANPDQNPFFLPEDIDEDAFTPISPPPDYSQSHIVEAIGLERSKTVIHIPLIRPSGVGTFAATSLRFPIAILSFLTPIVPFPSNLRQSLTYLLPHLATSFSLAQHYTQLEMQSTGKVDHRMGDILGLGGTFSDESSELELVAGLTGHINQAFSDEGAGSLRSNASPGELSSTSTRSPNYSTGGTPSWDNLVWDRVSTPAVAVHKAPDANEGYFGLKRTTSKQASQSKTKGSLKTSKSGGTTTNTPSKSKMKPLKESDSPMAEIAGSIPSSATSEQRQTSRHPSTISINTQIPREISTRLLPEKISQLMLNHMPLQLFLAKASNGELVWTNAKFDGYRKANPQDQRIKDPWQNVIGEERESLLRRWQKALETGAQFTHRVRVKRFDDDNDSRWFIFRASPLLSAHGEVLYWIGSFIDVHEQHIAEMKAAQERELFAQDAKYKSLADAIPQIVFEAANDRGIVFVNEKWPAYSGQTREDILGFGFARHIHKDDIQKCGIFPMSGNFALEVNSKQNIEVVSDGGTPSEGGSSSSSKTVLGKEQGGSKSKHLDINDLVKKGLATIKSDENGEVSYSTEIRLRHRSGVHRWHLVRLVKADTIGVGSNELTWYGTCTDVHEMKELEWKLSAQMEGKTKFFSNMSHEIRTPLNGILGTIPFLLETTLDNDQRRMIETISNSSSSLAVLVDNILDVSKVEAGKMTLVLDWFHIRSLLEDVIDTISSKAIEKRLELNYLVDSSVPSTVFGDRFRVRQILINLIGNAIKFTSAGEIYTRCFLKDTQPPGFAKGELLISFEVVDTGKGFTREDAQRLMQQFSQIQGGTIQQSGSGLGLFLSKQLVEMHGGTLTPKGEEGQGATFTFTLKVKVPTDENQPPTSPTSAQRMKFASVPSIIRSSAFNKPGNLVNSPGSIRSSDSGSPAFHSSASSEPSIKSVSLAGSTRSSMSSAYRTPDVLFGKPAIDLVMPTERLSSIDATPEQNLEPPGREIGSTSPHPTTYSILIICPADHARDALKQHIELVVPHQIAVNIIAVHDVLEWEQLVNLPEPPSFTHLVLNLSENHEVEVVMRHVLQTTARIIPELVIVADLAQKKTLQPHFQALMQMGRKVDFIPKPVKPSFFAKIFDPAQQRDLSKDRNRDLVQEVSNTFKTVTKQVQAAVGNKGHRILVVEDDDTNRGVSSCLFLRIST